MQTELVYFLNDLILRECYPDPDVSLIAFFQTIKISTVIKPNLSTENPKLYEDVSLSISDLFCAGYKKHSHSNENIKKENFYDWKRLGLQNAEQRRWYSTLLKKLSDVMPDVRTLFELKMKT